MKFFWKIYFSFIAVFLVAFGLFGTWMIQMAFESSYQKALEDGEWDNRMYQLAFEMNLSSMDEENRTEEMIPVMAAAVVQNFSSTGNIYRIYNEEQKLLYESQSSSVRGTDVLPVLSEEQPCSYSLYRLGDQTWLVYACWSSMGGQVYLLESLTDISSIYAESVSYYNMYRMMMLVLILVMTVIVFAVAGMLTRSVNRLSHITRRFTNGDLDARASESGGDEIAELSKDFNRMAATLSDKMEELTLQAQRQEDFTASFSHELKTPLTSIIGYADMLRTMDCTKEEVVDAAGYIYQQGKRLENLSRKMLDMIVAGKQELSLRALDVENLVEEAVRITEESRQAQNVTLAVDLEEGCIEGDRTLLISAVTNILENARRAMPSGGQIQIRGKNYPNSYLLCISDNGCGIEAEEISRITEAFYMIDKSRARKEGGAGLGLALCSRILALHAARWKIFSRPGKGTDIAISFRCGEVQDEDL